MKKTIVLVAVLITCLQFSALGAELDNGRIFGGGRWSERSFGGRGNGESEASITGQAGNLFQAVIAAVGEVFTMPITIMGFTFTFLQVFLYSILASAVFTFLRMVFG
jgi:hypothetical protein